VKVPRDAGCASDGGRDCFSLDSPDNGCDEAPAPHVVFAARVPAADLCGGESRWRRGSTVGFPAPPLTLPLRVQLQAEGAACRESTYSSAQINKLSLFEAKSD
jgi:hypothetical protein